jgi:hypothetical protein
MAKRSFVERWLRMAHDARVAAGKMRDSESQRTMLEIAVNYERLAERAAKLEAAHADDD